MVQLREKNGNMKEFYHDAPALRRITDTYSIPLIINDRLDLMFCNRRTGHPCRAK